MRLKTGRAAPPGQLGGHVQRSATDRADTSKKSGRTTRGCVDTSRRRLGLFGALPTMHNLVSAGAAFPIGHVGDQRSKRGVLPVGYVFGVATNAMLAFLGGSLPWPVVAILPSGVYIAAEETLEKAAAAEFLPRELRSLGFGLLACVNGVGDMVSSLYVGFLLEAGNSRAAFGTAAVLGALGVFWLAWPLRKSR